MEPAGTNRRAVAVCLALAALGLIAWWPVTANSFINYDDPDYITKNPFVSQGLTLDGLIEAFKFHSANWHPLTWLSHMLDVTLFGQEAGWHHLVSALLHTVNGLLLFALLHSLTGSLWQSALVAALFTLHPLRVESVAWAAERKDVLSVCFWLLTMCAYVRHARQPSPQRMALVCFLYLLGIMAKPMVVTLPFALLLLDFWPLRRMPLPPGKSLADWPAWRRSLAPLVLEKMPLFILSALACVVTLFAQKSGNAIQSLDKIPLTLRTGNAIHSVARYLGKLFWPDNLSIYYPMPDALSWPPVLFSLAVIAFISYFAVRRLATAPWLAFGWCWFLGTLFPVIGLVQVGTQAFADRYTYIPSIGFFVAVVWSVSEFTAKWPRRAWFAWVGGVALLVTCLSATWKTIPNWRDSETLFSQALPKNYQNVVVTMILGNAYFEAGKLDEAIEQYVAALKIRPRYAEAHFNWGNVLGRRQQWPEAIQHYEEAIQINPGHVDARLNLANALAESGRSPEAIALLNALLKQHPKEYRAHNNLGNALAAQGQWAEAIEHFKQALKLHPANVETLNNWGNALADQGNLQAAEGLYLEAMKRNPSDARTRNELGRLYAELNRLPEAIKQYSEALRLNPAFVEAHLNYGLALAVDRQFEAAAAHFKEALRLRPNSAEAHNNLGYILTEEGKARSAAAHYAEAVRLKPTLAPALNSLARIYAADPDANLRNGAEAVRLAEKACTLTQRRQILFLDTLAAAYAEAGRFPEAIATARETIELATRMGQSPFATQVQERLNLYSAGRPWRGP
jgi:tetratricopeptide (TPR) repeat protein